MHKPNEPGPRFVPDPLQKLSTSAPLLSQNVARLQNSEFEHTGYGTAPGFGPFDDNKPEWNMDGCSLAMSKGRKWFTPPLKGTMDDVAIRNNHHRTIHAAPHDHWVISSSPVTNLSSHRVTGQYLLGYLQGNKNTPVFRELPFVHYTSAGSACAWFP